MATEEKTAAEADSTVFNAMAVFELASKKGALNFGEDGNDDAVYPEFKPHQFKPRPLGDNDVEIKIEVCGVCMSDVHTCRGGWNAVEEMGRLPLVVGHEIVGVVTKAGKGVTRHKVGDRVGVGAQVLACMGCSRCKKDRPQYCQDVVYTYDSRYPPSEEDPFGYVSKGGYADGVRVHEDFTVQIPASLKSQETAPLLCAGITLYSPLNFYGAGTRNKRVGIVGIGGLGHLGVMMAKKIFGAETYAISHTNSKRELCLNELGADYFIASSDKAQMREFASRLDLLICTVNARNFDISHYFSLMDCDSTFCIVGLPDTDAPFAGVGPEMLSMQMHKRMALTASNIGGPKEIEEMLQKCADAGIGAMTQAFPMSQATKAVRGAIDGKARFRHVLVMDLEPTAENSKEVD